MNQGNDLEPKKPKTRNWLYILSPCMLASALAVIEIIGSWLYIKDSGGYSFIAAIVGAIFLGAMVLVDIIVKLLITKQVLIVWGIEGIIIISIVFYLTHI